MIAAVVPAAGHSQRMGRPKLILTVDGRTVISRVVTALRAGGASRVVVVAPPADAAGASILHDEARAAGAELIVPATRPNDMRASVEHALDHLERGETAPATVLLVPADSPGLNPELVALIVERAKAEPGAILVPVVAGNRGHPVALPWPVALGVRALHAGVGVNALMALNAAKVVEV
ncbi:MAG TPA: NTP transferase domain-containing protein, partial [Isosphaeraceae bacterium]|nr:NTP transferase domain-containing protein [Isosphaeraceae bacterium]